MRYLWTGYEACDTVNIVNAEDDAMQFTFVESSCHAAGYTVCLTVEPLHGTVPPHSRSVLICIYHLNLFTYSDLHTHQLC